MRQEPARIRRTRRDRQNLRIFGFVCALFDERDRLVRLLPGRPPVIPVGHFARPEGLCPGELCSRRSARDGSSNHPHVQVRRGPVVVSLKKKCVQSSLCGRIWDHQSQASRIGADSPAIHGTSARARPPPSTIDRIANRTPSFMRRREWAIYLIICSGISGFVELIARIPGRGFCPFGAKVNVAGIDATESICWALPEGRRSLAPCSGSTCTPVPARGRIPIPAPRSGGIQTGRVQMLP